MTLRGFFQYVGTLTRPVTILHVKKRDLLEHMS